MIPVVSLLSVLASLSGCTAQQVEGVWMFMLDPLADSTCQEALSHNFTNAVSIDGDEEEEGINPWTEEESSSSSGSLAFAQITYSGDDAALLVMGGQAFPGVLTATGTWLFTWEGRDDSNDYLGHTQGYSYTESNQATSTTTLTLTFDKDTVSGDLQESSTSLKTWTESDNWNDNLVGLGTGQIPASEYLLVVNPINNKETAATNEALSEDCDNEPCSLSLSNACDSARAVAGTRTGYDDEDAYDLLEGYGQAEGAVRPEP